MGGGGKGGGGGGSQLHDYYGVIAGTLAVGQCERLVSFIVDGEEVWPGAAAWKTGQAVAVNDLRYHRGRTWKVTTAHTTASDKEPPNASFWTPYFLQRIGDMTVITIAGRGAIHWYWGTQTQGIDTLLQSAGNDAGQQHPAYRGMVCFVLNNFLFGRERVSAPNVEAVFEIEPQQSVVTGGEAILRDGDVNPAVALAVLLTHPVAGLGYAAAMLDATSFQATANGFYAEPGATYCSLLVDSQESVRSVISKLCDDFDMFVRWNPQTRKVECGRFTHGVTPSVFTSLTIDDLRSRPIINSGKWAEMKTGCTVVFRDRERAYKMTTESFDDPRLVSMVGESRRETIQMPWIVRRDQALAYAVEWTRVHGTPQMHTRKLDVRREKGRGLRPGDWVRLDIDATPNGAQLLQYFRVLRTNLTTLDGVQVDVIADSTLTPVAYTPGAMASPIPSDEDVPAIPAARVFEVGEAFGSELNSVAILAQRPDNITTGFQIWFNSTGSGSFQMLGQQPYFAVKGLLRRDLNAVDEAPSLLIVVPAQSGADLLANSISAEEGVDDTYLVIVMTLDGGGQILGDALGQSSIEIFSATLFTLNTSVAWASGVSIAQGEFRDDAGVKYWAKQAHTSSGANQPPNATYWAPLVSTDKVYTVTALRGRMSSFPHECLIGSTSEVWIVPRQSLQMFGHAEFDTLRKNRAAATTPDTAYFRLQPFTYWDTRDLVDVSNTPFKFNAKPLSAPSITIVTPAWDYQAYANAAFNPTALNISIQASISDVDGDLSDVEILVSKDGASSVALYRSITGPTFHELLTTFVLSAVGSYDIDIIARDRSGWIAQKRITIVGFDAVGTLPSMSINIEYPQYGGAITGVAPGSTQARSNWNSVTWYRWHLPKDIHSVGGGSFEWVVTAVGVTTMPTTGWTTRAVGAWGAQTVCHLNETITGTLGSTFKIWVRAKFTGWSDSPVSWLIFQ